MLPFDRFLNLVYYAIVRQLAPEAKQQLDRVLAGPVVATGPAPSSVPVAAPAAVVRGGKKVPPWWKGDGAAAASSLQAARELRLVK